MNHPVKSLAQVLVVCLALLSGGCGQKAEQDKPRQKTGLSQDQQISALLKRKRQLYLWSVYWDNKASLTSVYQHAGKIAALGDFAASYTKKNRLFLPAASQELAKRVRQFSVAKLPVYLTVVNDRPNDLKSLELLQSLLETPESRKQAVQEIVSLAKSQRFSGVALDFEKIRGDLSLWRKFISFEEELQTRCQKSGLQLRVVLESSTPKAVKLPKGPDYVVMCYNLYYSGTKPGPKADKAFLKQVARKFKQLPNVSYALANGGFDFKGKSAAALTSNQVAALLDQKKAIPKRDAESGAMHFKYGLHEVWYADSTTLAEWAKTLDQASGRQVAISLWRIE